MSDEIKKIQPDKGAKEPLSVEKALSRLEQIVAKLESGEIDLDESFKIFERAVKISQKIQSKLSSYERKIEMMSKNASNGRISPSLPPEDLN